jgi:DNA-binding SARP family transcriptional activator
MPRLKIYLFGKFSVQYDDEGLKGLDACKVQELLCYLLVHCNRPHSREMLASLLWGESATDKSKKYLRQAFWHLQGALDTLQDNLFGQILSVEHDWVQLNVHVELWLDVAVFEQAFRLVQGVQGGELGEEQAEILQAVVPLYRGDLLEGWYQDWCLYERERLQNMYLLMLDKLMSYCAGRRSFERGYDYGARILRHDRARERTHRQLMYLQYLDGDRTGALRQYERCVAALEEELGVEPDGRTVALYEQIRAGHLDEAAVTPPDGENLPAAGPISLPEVLGRLKRLQTILAVVQRRVQRDIKAVEVGLKAHRD